MVYTQISSPLDPLTMAAENGAVTGLWMEGQKYFAAGLSPDAVFRDGDPVLMAAARWLDAYFGGEDPGPLPVPLAPGGTPFQQRVWTLLREIPRGTTVTYGELSARLGSSPRAVGSAVGRNPISILIPCHRVLGAGSAITGYAGGIERKRFLLELEGVTLP